MSFDPRCTQFAPTWIPRNGMHINCPIHGQHFLQGSGVAESSREPLPQGQSLGEITRTMGSGWR